MPLGDWISAGLAGLTAGSALAGLGGYGETTSNASNTTTVELPPWLEEASADLVGRSRALALEDYQTYPGQRIADFSPDQQASFNLARQSADAYKPYLQTAADRLGGIPAMFDADAAAQYMNPYESAVTQDVLSDMDRQYGMRERDIGDNLVKTGNFGGSRAGIRMAELDRNRADTQRKFINQSRSQNYQQALQQFNADRNLQSGLSSQYAGLGGWVQQLGLQGAQGLSAQGGQQQALQQRSLDTAYGDFQAQRQHPYGQMNFLRQQITGIPSPQTTSGISSAPGPNQMTQMAGLGISGLGMLGGMKPGTQAHNWMWGD